MAAFTIIGSQVNLVDGTQSLEKVSWDANDTLTPTLNLVAGTTADASWAAGVVSGTMEWASANTDTKTVTQLGKFATHLGAVGGGANIALFTTSVLSEKGVNGTDTGLAFNATAGLFAIGAAGVIFFAPEALLVMGTLNALSLAFTAMGLMTNDNQTIGGDLKRLNGLLKDFFEQNPIVYDAMTPMEKAKYRQMLSLGDLSGDNNQQNLPTLNDFLAVPDHRSTTSEFLTYNPAGAVPPPPPRRVDPLVLDLNHDGIINTLSLASSKTFFDLDNDGMSELSGWVAPSDGILVYDRDENGRIDSSAEVFGKANKDGFTELKEVGDSNGDNVFDANDTLYNTLKVWTDTNSDGISQADELHTLSELNISSISLTKVATSIDSNGNTVTETGSFIQDGQTYIAADVALQTNDAITDYRGDYTLSIDTLFMPWLRGYGNVKDAQIAYSMNDDLKLFAMGLMNDSAKAYAEFDTFLKKWTGLELLHTTAGINHILLTVDDKVWMMETFVGGSLYKTSIETAFNNKTGTANNYNIAYIDAQYTALKDRYFTLFAAQSFFTEAFQGSYYSVNQDKFIVTDPALLASSVSAYLNTVTDDMTLIEFAKVVQSLNGDFGLTKNSISNVANSIYTTIIGDVLDGQYQTVLMSVNATTGSAGNDLIGGSSGDDTINAGDGTNTVYGDIGNDTINSGSGADMLDGGEGNDVIRAGSGNDTVYGQTGDDVLYGNSGADVLNGGEGNDTIIADDDGYYDDAAYADTLIGGKGDDTLKGGAGNDVYVFNIGDGADTVYDYDYFGYYNSNNYYNAGNDTIQFGEGIQESDISIFKSGSNLILSYGDNDLITVTNQSNVNNAIEKFTLSDGNYLTSNDMNLIIQSMNAYATDHGLSIDSIDTVKANQELMNIVAGAWHQ